MPGQAFPELITETTIEEALENLFADHFAVVIENTDFTTFAEVESACVVLFGYTPDEAAALAMRVQTGGEAVAAVMAEIDARKAVRSLRRWNVRSHIEKV